MQNIIIANDPKNKMDTEIYNYQDKFKAILLLFIYDEGRQGTLIQDINEYSWNVIYNYSTSISGMYDLMVQHLWQLEVGKGGVRKGQYHRDKPKVVFYQKLVQHYQEEGGNLVPVTDGSTRNIMCYNYNSYDYMVYNFPETDHSQGCRRYGFLHIGISLLQQYHQAEVVIYTKWILLAKWSTTSFCNNIKMLQDIKTFKSDEVLPILKYVGSHKYEMMGKFKIITICAHYNPGSLSKHYFCLNVFHWF